MLLRNRIVQHCPLCDSRFIEDFFQEKQRIYYKCLVCDYIFADPSAFLSPVIEKTHYDQHQNSPDDPAYRQFLSRLAVPLIERLGDEPQQGLDFGSGPGPTLSVMLAEKGHTVAVYDPYYANNPSLLKKVYDFVTCTEAMEHFYAPGKEWKTLLKMVKPGGWLGITTRLLTEEQVFANWYYKNEETHVGFFSRKTFRFLAHRDGLAVEFVGDDVILLQKNPLPGFAAAG